MNGLLNVHSLNVDFNSQTIELENDHLQINPNQTTQQFNLTYMKDKKEKNQNQIKLKNILKNKNQQVKGRSHSSSTVAYLGAKPKAIKFQYYYKSIKQYQKQSEKKCGDISVLSNLKASLTSQKSMSQQMLQSMKKYLRRIQKNKLQLKKKSEESNCFGLKVLSIQKQIHYQGQNSLNYQNNDNINYQKFKKFQSPKRSFLLNKKIINNNSQLIGSNQEEQFKNHSKTESFINLRIDQKSIVRKQKMSRSIYKYQNQKKKQKTIKYRTEFMKKNMIIVMSSYKCKMLEKMQMENNQKNKIDANNISKTYNKITKFTYFIGYGNNRNLIRSIFKKRWWWSEAATISQANFVWTQLKNVEILDKIKIQKQENNKILQESNKNMQENIISNLLFQDIDIKIENKKIKIKNSQFRQMGQTSFFDKYYNIFHKDVPIQQLTKIISFKMPQNLLKIQRPNCVHNHYTQNYMFGNKNALFHNIKAYFSFLKKDMFTIVPLTFYIDKKNKSLLKEFQAAFKQEKNKKSIWIVKPAQNSNRGQGIFVSNNLQQIKRLVSSKKDGKYILQKYLKNNFLFQKRKFDIRTYILMVTIGNTTKFFWYQQGYLRTSSQIFDLSDLTDIYVHLTNDAIQTTSQNYGKYQNGNKLTYIQFQRYLDLNYAHKNYSMNNLNMEMKNIARTAVNAIYPKIDTQKTNFSFQLFGLDFLIDSNFKPWLLEINTNPCLQLSSPILQRLIPRLIQNIWRITVDIMFQPQQKSECSKAFSYFVYDNVFQTNKFQLIFDSNYDRDLNWEIQCKKSLQSSESYQDQTEIFANEGKQIEFQF